MNRRTNGAGAGWVNGCVEDGRVSTGMDKVGMPSAPREKPVRAIVEGVGSAANKEESVNRRGESGSWFGSGE